MDKNDITDLAGYIGMLANGLGHPVAQLVLAHGRSFVAAKRPKGYRKLAYKQCYMHAGQRALADRGLVYCEGYALSELGIPTEHAWCATPQGVVIDETWRHPQRCQYFGVPFSTDYLLGTLQRTGVWGVFGWFNKEIIDLPPADFLAPCAWGTVSFANK